MKSSVSVQCNLKQLQSTFLILSSQRVYVLALVKAGFHSECPIFAVVLVGFA